MIVMGCATENRILCAMFIRSTMFDIKAITSCTALIATSLRNPLARIIGLDKKTYHFGSSIGIPFCSAAPGGIETRQWTINAQILNAEAIGPKVPAMSGNAVLANHHRLVRCQYSGLVCGGDGGD